MQLKKTALLLASATVLTACLVPEKFTAQADFRPDGSYVYKFDGTVVHGLVAMAEKQSGKLNDKQRSDLKQQVQEFSKAPGVKKFKAISDSRYELSSEEVLPPEPRRMRAKTTEVFVIDNREFKASRILTVTGPKLQPKDDQGFKELGVKLDGKVSVILPKGAKVLEHNANGTPGMFNKDYSWSVTSTTDKPMIRFQLSNGT